MKIFSFKNFGSLRRPIKIRASSFNSALLVATCFLSEPAYVGEMPA